MIYRRFAAQVVLLSVLISGALACQLPMMLGAPPASTSTQAVLASPVASETPVTTTPGIQAVQVYLVALEDAGKNGPAVGCGDSLVAVSRPRVSASKQPVQAALEALFAIKQQTFGQSGLYNALWQSDLRVQRVTLDGQGMAAVALTGTHLLGGECDVPRFKGQILQTILAAPGVKTAVVLLDGQPIDQALSLK